MDPNSISVGYIAGQATTRQRQVVDQEEREIVVDVAFMEGRGRPRVPGARIY